jgi:hypothetical protein
MGKNDYRSWSVVSVVVVVVFSVITPPTTSRRHRHGSVPLLGQDHSFHYERFRPRTSSRGTFQIEQGPFGGRPAAVAAEAAVGADDPMARHHDRDGICRAGRSDGANSLGRT